MAHSWQVWPSFQPAPLDTANRQGHGFRLGHQVIFAFLHGSVIILTFLIGKGKRPEEGYVRC